MRKLWPLVALLLIMWAIGVEALDEFPLHNDEGLHLTRAVQVWHLHPFWEINDGKIINHWLIAAFYPQNAPDFTGRIATVIVGMIGLAAGYTLAYTLFGLPAAFLACVLWIVSPYLFFYERFALSDSETGALVVLALLGSVYVARFGKYRDAVLTGLALAAAILFKFTGAPFSLMVGLVILFTGQICRRKRLTSLVVIGGVVAASLIIPLIYVFAHGAGFQIALGWIASTQPGHNPTVGANLDHLWAQLTGFGSVSWSVVMGLGLVALCVLGRGRLGMTLVVACLAPLAIIIVIGTDVMPRHFVVALPAALVLAGMGLGSLLNLLRQWQAKWAVVAAITAVLVASFIPFAEVAYTAPAVLPLPELDRAQFVTGYSAGFGLRDAVLAFPQTITEPDEVIVGSMFPDSCRRANFYAAPHYSMICSDAPGTGEIDKALAARGRVYVLVEKPPIGIDSAHYPNTTATKIAAYPRPGENAETAAVVLWRLDAITSVTR